MKPRYADIPSLYTHAGSRKYLNDAERRRVLRAASALVPDQRLFVLTLVWTGARLSEVLALMPLSFQVEPSVVAIHTPKRRRHHVREVPIPPTLSVALSRHFHFRAI